MLNESLYNFYINQLIKMAKTNPLYQYPMLLIFNNGILWDIERYKKAKLYTSLTAFSVKKTQKRIYIGLGGRRRLFVDDAPPFLRTVNYFSTVSVLLGIFPEVQAPLSEIN